MGLKQFLARWFLPNNCGYHQWEEASTNRLVRSRHLRIDTHTSGSKHVYRKKRYACAHEGCGATKQEWERVGYDIHESYVMNKKLRRFLEE